MLNYNTTLNKIQNFVILITQFLNYRIYMDLLNKYTFHVLQDFNLYWNNFNYKYSCPQDEFAGDFF